MEKDMEDTNLEENIPEERPFLEKIRILDRAQLKLFAVFCMVIDHLGVIFFDDALWMRCIGRLAMPIFCFFVAEGYYHTHDRKRYLLRMGLFALISELPFDLAFYGQFPYWRHQNVMFTFFLAIAAMYAYQEIMARRSDNVGKILGIAAVLGCAFLAVFCFTDYNASGVAIVFLFFIMKDRGLLAQNGAVLMYQLFIMGAGTQAFSMLSSVPLMMYNGEKGRKLKWFFYCFYPAHLLLFGVIARLLIYKIVD